VSSKREAHSSRVVAQHATTVKKRLWPRLLGWGIVGVFGIVIIAGVVFAVQAISVATTLLAAKDEISLVVDDATSGDTESLENRATKIQDMVSDANSTVSGPLWGIASDIPLVGENVNAVRLATQATHTLVDGALPPGIKVLEMLDLGSTSVEDGGIDLAPLKDAESSLPEISDAFTSANDQVSNIDREKLLPVVDDAVGSLIDVFEVAAPALDIAEKYLPNILDVAGADEPRRYMLIFQNNAEIRAGGGLPGATAIVDVENGKADLAEQTSTYSFRRDMKVIEPPLEMDQLYETDTFMGFGNYTRTPNFATTGEAFNSIWNITTGTDLDGVISLDPVALSYMLVATGPVTASDGTKLTSDNVVEELLYNAYQRLPVSEQDEFFGDAAKKVFDKISSGDWDPLEMVDQLVKASNEDRLKAWFPREAEETMVADLGIDGQLPTSNEEVSQPGLFVNDFSASKLTYFLSSDMTISCDADAGTMTTELTVANSAPVGQLADYQLGRRNARYGIARETFILDAMYFALPGTEIVSANTPPDDYAATRVGVENERNVQLDRYFIPAGTEKTISYTSTLPTGEVGPLDPRFSPTVTDTGVTIASSCADVFPAQEQTTE